jgi:hypothetical protein
MADRIRFVLRLTRWLALLVLGCGGPGSAFGPKAAASGQVVERAEGYESSPAWATKDAPWSQNGSVLSVVGHVEVAANQRLEMAHRAADSYARAELLRFLKTRVFAVIEESTTTSAGESVKERIEEVAEAVVDDWLIQGRYWEKRKVRGKVRLDVYSRMDVDLASVTALLEKAALADDLRLTLSQKLERSWVALQKEAILAASDAHPERGITPPEWARAGDQQSDEDFSFVCQGSAAEEVEALALAKARCDEKLCRLLGVRIQARTSITETLEDMSAESQVSEQCDARIVGRAVSNKGGECGPNGCVFWLRQTYPRAEYEKELARLDAPQIIRQEVVIQEGDKHYKDPASCEAALRSYAGVSSGSHRDAEEQLSAAAFSSRVRYLKQALGACQGIDGRDSGLFQALNTILLTPLPTFINEGGAWTGGHSARTSFIYAPAGFRRDLETKRFLTDRILAILTICQDALLPMRLFDLPGIQRDRGPTAEELRASAAVLDELLEVPFDDRPYKPSYREALHAIVLDSFYGSFPPSTPRYRQLLLTQLEGAKLACSSGQGVSAHAVLGYLSADRGLDAEEWSAGLGYLRRAQDPRLERCIEPLLDARGAPEKTQRPRAKELCQLILSGKVSRTSTKGGKTTRAARDGELLVHVFGRLSPQDQLALYLDIRAELDPKDEQSVRLATKVMEANFSAKYHKPRESDQPRCESLPERLGPLLTSAPELRIQDSMACTCMDLRTLPQASRAALRQLWLTETNERCLWFQPAEHPDGLVKWPYPERRWGAGPFARIDHVLSKEAGQCERSTGITGLRFSPTIRATLTAGRLSRTSVTAVPYGTLMDLRWEKPHGGRERFEWVRKADVEAATRGYETCLAKAADGYQVAPEDLATKETGPQRIWHQMGDQGSSNGFGE